MDLQVSYLGHSVVLRDGETVLEALERAGANPPSSCRAGACQFCMMRVVEGTVPSGCQEGLREALRKTGHFLSCICKPITSITCEPANIAPFKGQTSIHKIWNIGPDVVLVRLIRPAEFVFSPGQFVTFSHERGKARSYSIASIASDSDFFDIHVRLVPGGKVSTWFHKEARPGDCIWIEGPKGDCIYYPGNSDEPLTLVGIGTGIAPLFAVVANAIRCGHRGVISIYHGAVSEDRLYFVGEISKFVEQYQNIKYSRCVMQGPASDGVFVGDIKQIAVADLTSPRARRVYLCGDSGIVRALKKQVFLAGVSFSKIHADPFV